MTRRTEKYCSLCGTSDCERFLIFGPHDSNICECCAELCWDIIVRRRFDEENQEPAIPEPLIPPNGPPKIPEKSAPCIISPEKIGFIYFVHAKLSNRIKIGWSANPEKRIADLLTGCPEPLECLGTISGRITDERALHERFVASRVHREWFTANQELLVYIAEATA